MNVLTCADYASSAALPFLSSANSRFTNMLETLFILKGVSLVKSYLSLAPFGGSDRYHNAGLESLLAPRVFCRSL